MRAQYLCRNSAPVTERPHFILLHLIAIVRLMVTTHVFSTKPVHNPRLQASTPSRTESPLAACLPRSQGKAAQDSRRPDRSVGGQAPELVEILFKSILRDSQVEIRDRED